MITGEHEKHRLKVRMQGGQLCSILTSKSKSSLTENAAKMIFASKRKRGNIIPEKRIPRCLSPARRELSFLPH